MKPAMALIVGLLLIGQAVAPPVEAADTGSGSTAARAQTEKSPVKPGGLSPTDSLTAGPIGDVKVELDSTWWVGNERHAKFRVANSGSPVPR